MQNYERGARRDCGMRISDCGFKGQSRERKRPVTDHGPRITQKLSGRTKPFRRKVNAAREKGRGKCGLRIEQSNPGNSEGSDPTTPEARLGEPPNTYFQRTCPATIARQSANSLKCLNLRGKSLCCATVISKAGAVASKECTRAEIQECAVPA